MKILYFFFFLAATTVNGQLVSHNRRLRDISYAYGIDLLRPEQGADGLYDNSHRCDKHSTCLKLTTTNKYTPICISMGEAAVAVNQHVFNGILCPPFHYDLMVGYANDSSAAFTLKVHSGHLSTQASTTTTTAAATTTVAATTGTGGTIGTTSSSTSLRQHLVIHSKEEENELLGLFDVIEPKQKYLIKYASAFHTTCRFASGSKGNSTSLTKEVCYDATEKRLVLRSEVEHDKSTDRCLVFYTILDDTMTQFNIVQNQTLVDEDKKRTDGKHSYDWSYASKGGCSNSYTSGGIKTSDVLWISHALSLLGLIAIR